MNLIRLVAENVKIIPQEHLTKITDKLEFWRHFNHGKTFISLTRMESSLSYYANSFKILH